ncbi:MAG: orotidine-5'-phosphate decarboxylase [Acidobacteria bacterium]|nr:orotidine-5'-phosphate decarboxylase [Acidobacteriota bacterium]
MLMKDGSARDKLILALDVETAREARRVVEMLHEHVGMFKINAQLFTAAGPDVVREIVGEGGRVFLDLKYHDIPNTVASACQEAVRLGVSLFNVHASGGSEMMRRAAEATSNEATRLGREKPALIAVTVLTSADAATISEIGIAAPSVEAQVRRLAQLAAACGLDGVVASPHEIAPVRAAVEREGFLLVTPGVRPAGVAHDDQKRVMTPAEAVRAGADYLVVGRAILNAPDPARAALEIVEEMESGRRKTEDGRNNAVEN